MKDSLSNREVAIMGLLIFALSVTASCLLLYKGTRHMEKPVVIVKRSYPVMERTSPFRTPLSDDDSLYGHMPVKHNSVTLWGVANVRRCRR